MRIGALLAVLLVVRVATAGDEVQVWTELGVEAPVGERFRVGLHEEIRFTEGAGRLGLHNTDAGVAWLAGEHVMLTLGFTQEFARTDGTFLAESRPRVDVTLRGTVGGIDLEGRQRFEGRLLERRPDAFRYRSRLRAVAPWSLWPKGPRPFAAEELLVQSGGPGIDQNRLQGGLAASFGPLSGTLYYMLLSARRGGWAQSHVLGVTLTYSFGGSAMMSSGG